MKKLLLAFAFVFLAFTQGVKAQAIFNAAMQTTVTNIAATATNAVAAPYIELIDAPLTARIYLSASGIAATTNGSLTVYFGTSGTSTNNFDKDNLSNIKLTSSTIGNTTNMISDWFNISGVKYIRVGEIQNTHAGVVSNINVYLSYTKSRQ